MDTRATLSLPAPPGNARRPSHADAGAARGAGGFAGAIARLLVGDIVTARLGRQRPYGTLVVNVSGCFLPGLVLGALHAGAVHPAVRPLVATGFLGAYTTFSTFGTGLAAAFGALPLGRTLA